MGHGKLRKFRENEGFRCLLQPQSSDVLDFSDGDVKHPLVLKQHPVSGHWNEQMFRRDAPIVLELGCGRGEYTVDLACRRPACNYIGVDIKGARLWKGAKYATDNDLGNVAFLRTRIEFIEAFFVPGEVSEIWLTFSDPQLKSENKRLTCPGFLDRYVKFLKPGGVIHLKTDSRFLYEYSLATVRQNGLELLSATPDLYGEGRDTVLSGAEVSVCGEDAVSALFEVQTYYERLFLSDGYKITYLSFKLDKEGPFVSPEWDKDYFLSIEGKRHTAGRRLIV